jgi:hypothetical protein
MKTFGLQANTMNNIKTGDKVFNKTRAINNGLPVQVTK